ncbi:hypothetical protein MyNCGM121_03870 [Achromobacter xylosoxidans]
MHDIRVPRVPLDGIEQHRQFLGTPFQQLNKVDPIKKQYPRHVQRRIARSGFSDENAERIGIQGFTDSAAVDQCR